MQIETLLLLLLPLLPVFLALIGLGKWLSNSENRDKAKLSFLKLLRKLGMIRFDRSTVSVQAAVLMKPRIRELNSENPEASLPIAEIEFSKTLDESTMIKDGELYIRLRDSKSEAWNLVRIAEEYTRMGVMYRARSITDPKIRKAVDLTIMHRLVSSSDEALRIWHERCYQPYLAQKEILDTLKMISYVEEVGYLTRIFLPELELVANRLGFQIKPSVVEETTRWLDMVHPLAQKCDEDPLVNSRDVNLILRGNEFGVGVVLVARSSTVAFFGTRPHEAWVLEYLADSQIRDIYVIGHGLENCYDALRVVANTYLREDVAEVWPAFYHTTFRGNHDVPVVLTRYIKGDSIDEPRKRVIVQKFLRSTQKKLPRVKTRKSDLINWCQRNVEKLFGDERFVTTHQCGLIAEAMNEYGFMLEDLEGVLENEVADEEYCKFLDGQGIRFLYPHEEILYKVHWTGGLEQAEIASILAPHISRNHGFRIEIKEAVQESPD